MREYMVENGPVDIHRLQSDKMADSSYKAAHEGTVICCHDVFIHYDDGILLVNRMNHPAKDLYWPIGGRLQRGKTIETSIREKVMSEANLELDDIIHIGEARTFFQSSPYDNGKGTDTLNLVYLAFAKGELKLDSDHRSPLIILPNQYDSLKDSLHPYVRDFLYVAIMNDKRFWKGLIPRLS